jgi:GMP synthase-like glutamine amidotransferase
MRMHWLQHVDFEGLGSIEGWAREKGVEVSCTRLFAGDILPPPEEFDLLVVMGGPMGVHDQEQHPWLRPEKEFLRQTIVAGKPIIGICLGAQLLALVLGGRVAPNPEKEIGWFPLERAPALPGGLEDLLPPGPRVFHWHGDSFTLPENAIRLYSSPACANQAFLYGPNILGLQFHLETTPASVAALVGHCREELVDSPWIQKEAEIMTGGADSFESINKLMAGLLEYLLAHS